MSKSLIEDPEKRKWFVKNYPDMSNQTIAIYLGISVDWVQKLAGKLNLKKSKEYMSSVRKSALKNCPKNRDMNGRFEKAV